MDRAGKVSNGKKGEIIIFSDEIGWHTDQLQIGFNLSGIKTRILKADPKIIEKAIKGVNVGTEIILSSKK